MGSLLLAGGEFARPSASLRVPSRLLLSHSLLRHDSTLIFFPFVSSGAAGHRYILPNARVMIHRMSTLFTTLASLLLSLPRVADHDLPTPPTHSHAFIPLVSTEPSGGAGGHASDFEITAKEILRMRAALTDIYRVHCSFPGETPEQSRDRFGESFDPSCHILF